MNKYSIRWHLLGWLAYAGYEVSGKFLEHSTIPLRIKLWLAVSFILIRLVEFYVCYLLVYPRFLRAGSTGALAAALGGGSALHGAACLYRGSYLPGGVGVS